jgi:hypothetical protein
MNFRELKLIIESSYSFSSHGIAIASLGCEAIGQVRHWDRGEDELE